MKKITKEQFVGEARSMAPFIAAQGTKVSDVARHLATTPDFSTATAREIDDILAHLKNLVGCLKKVKSLTVQRGLTALDEEKARHEATLEEKRRQLLEGTLRVNRRTSDQAAE